MRPSPLIGSVVVIFAAASVWAGGPDVRTVVVPQAEVRAGPSTYEDCYPTNILPQGSQVEVVHDAGNGWLAIKPPPGSFSWINTSYVRQIIPTQPNYVVTVDGAGAPVLVGSWVRNVRPNKINAHLAKGTQVKRTGKVHPDLDGQGTMMCIEPPLGELRYIRAETVARSQTAAAVPGALTALSPGPRSAADPSRPPPAPDADALWRQAEQAATRGRIREAITLYKQAGSANSGVNPQRSEAAFRQAEYLEGLLNGSRTPPDGFTPAPSYPPRAPGYPPNARATPTFGRPVVATPVGYSRAPLGAPMAAGTGYGSSEQTWTGKIDQGSRLGNGDTLFVLEATSPPNQLLNLIPNRVDLRPYLHKQVRVSGEVKPPNKDIRAHHMIVTHVQPLS